MKKVQEKMRKLNKAMAGAAREEEGKESTTEKDDSADPLEWDKIKTPTNSIDGGWPLPEGTSEDNGWLPEGWK